MFVITCQTIGLDMLVAKKKMIEPGSKHKCGKKEVKKFTFKFSVGSRSVDGPYLFSGFPVFENIMDL